MWCATDLTKYTLRTKHGSIMDEYVISSRGICQERKGECNATQWFLLLLDDFQCLFDFIPHGVYYSNHLFLNAHCSYSPTHPLVHIIYWMRKQHHEKRKEGKKKTINIHTHSMQMDIQKLRKRGRTWVFFSFVQSFNVETIRYENAPKRNQIETMRIYRNVHRTHTLTQIKYPGSEWWRFFLFYFWAPKPFFWHIKFETEKRLPRYLVRACNANNLDAPRIRGCERQRTNQTCEWENVWKTRVRYIAYYIYLNVSISCACVCWRGPHTDSNLMPVNRVTDDDDGDMIRRKYGFNNAHTINICLSNISQFFFSAFLLSLLFSPSFQNLAIWWKSA